MNEQSKIPVGSKITTRKEYPSCIVDGQFIYGNLPIGATGEVIGHTADGRAMILFGDEIHTFDSLELLTVEIEPPTDEAAEWVDLAALHDAEIKRLRAANADLTAKLAAANAELHDLRIKAGITQR